MKFYSGLLLLLLLNIYTGLDALVVGDPARPLSGNACDTLESLAQALYSTKHNILHLTSVFYPPRQPGVNFLQVMYSFENATGDLDGCDVTYIWAKGGFMLIQPPSVLQYTSLFFSHNVNPNYHLDLRLPNACRHLVTNNGTNNGSECSCNQEEDDILDMLTHQVI